MVTVRTSVVLLVSAASLTIPGRSLAQRLTGQVAASAHAEREALLFEYNVSTDASSDVPAEVVELDLTGLSQIRAEIIAPSGWDGAVTPDLAAVWVTAQVGSHISPGNTYAGFQIRVANVLPILRRVLVRPLHVAAAENLAVPEHEGDVDAYLAAVRRALELGGFEVQSIGPGPAPDSPLPPVFIALILEYLNRSEQLGWVRDNGIVRSLRAKLENATAAFAEGRDKAAIPILMAFLAEVNALSPKQISPEATVLLSANVRFLLGKL